MNEKDDSRISKCRTRILVYHVGSIGDTIVALPAFRTLRHNFPDSEIRLINLSVADHPIHSQLYERNSVFSSCTFWTPPKNLLQKIMLYVRFLRLTLSGRYSSLYCFSPDLPRTLTGFWKIFQRTPVHHVFLFKKMGNIPLWQAYLDCLREQGLVIPDDCFSFPDRPEDRATASKLADQLDGECRIVFGIGGNQPVCRWPADRFSELIGSLRRNFDFLPVYAGGEVDRKVAEQLIARHGGIFLPDTECSSLRETMAFFRLCKCYIGNDTGTMHLAAAAGLPCTVIMSAHNEPEREWIPFGDRNLIFRKKIDCSGCHLKVCPKDDPAPCMAFSPDEIAEKIQNWITGFWEN